MPFHMDFRAFVNSYFAIAIMFFAVWGISSHWETLMMLVVCFMFERLQVDHTVKIRSEPSSNSAPCDCANDREIRNKEAGERDDRVIGAVSSSRGSVWSHFSARLILRRGPQETSVTTVEPARLAGVVCV
jgi:hypothetical protein